MFVRIDIAIINKLLLSFSFVSADRCGSNPKCGKVLSSVVRWVCLCGDNLIPEEMVDSHAKLLNNNRLP